jgi:aminoglycoside phosphotransferase (APT) family kinase protein
VVIDASLARRLIDSQFPHWSDLPVTAVELDGWDNRSFRLGPELTIRMPSGDWYQWSVYRWLDGTPASRARVGDPTGFATTLARFLTALGRIDATGGPEPGRHNFFRGGPLATYEGETLDAIDALGDEVPRDAVMRVWADAMAGSWEGEPVWFHGDVAVGNLLVRDGRLAAVLDFGSSGVGDPACDTVIAWTFLSGSSRDRFRAELGVDPGTWSRGRGWALWKALISLAGHLERDEPEAVVARRDIEQILADHARDR